MQIGHLGSAPSTSDTDRCTYTLHPHVPHRRHLAGIPGHQL